MTILLITPLFPDNLDTPRTRTTFAIYNFAKYWKREHHVIVVKPRKTSWRHWLSARDARHEMEGIPILSVPYFRISLFDLNIVNAMARRIRKALDRGNIDPDIVISHYHESIRFGARVACLLSRPFIAAIHKRDIENLDRGESWRYASSFMAAGLLVFRSASIERRFRAHFPKLVQPTFVANSGIEEREIETEFFCLGKARDMAMNSGLRIVTAASLIPRRCIDITLRALACITQRPWSFEILGEGQERPHLEGLTTAIGLAGRVAFRGHRSRQEVLEALRGADVFVMVSHHETFGLAYLEAMAKGCIVVGARGWGIDGIVIHGENGFLCEPGDVEGLVAVLQALSVMPAARLEQIATASWRTIHGLTEEVAAAAYRKAIEKTIVRDGVRHEI